MWRMRLRLFFLLQPLRTVVEEIVAQRLADGIEQGHRNPLGAESLVEVLGRAVHLTGQPRGGASLPLEFGLEEPAYVQFVGRYGCVSFHRRRFRLSALVPKCNKKGGESFLLVLIWSWGIAKHLLYK